MTVQTRMLTIRLLNEMEKHRDYCENLNISDKSKMKEKEKREERTK